MTSYFAGFGLGLSLIIAIGAQNAFVLRQGLRREHALAVAFACSASDAALIVVGVAGFGTLAEFAPWFGQVMRYGGAAFLFAYGALAFRSAWRGGGAQHADAAGEGGKASLARVLATTLALTWLNPHVYLDTVVLLGSVSSQYDSRVAFGTGAVCASFAFFFALAGGARFLAPVMARPAAWRVLDVVVGSVMWAIAFGLVLG